MISQKREIAIKSLIEISYHILFVFLVFACRIDKKESIKCSPHYYFLLHLLPLNAIGGQWAESGCCPPSCLRDIFILKERRCLLEPATTKEVYKYVISIIITDVCVDLRYK